MEDSQDEIDTDFQKIGGQSAQAVRLVVADRAGDPVQRYPEQWILVPAGERHDIGQAGGSTHFIVDGVNPRIGWGELLPAEINACADGEREFKS